jgi:hypothetical protein
VRLEHGYLLATLVAALWLLHWLWGRLREALARWEMRRRVRRGFSAERHAEELLEACGFRVIERQAVALWPVDCGGQRREIRLRADLLTSPTPPRAASFSSTCSPIPCAASCWSTSTLAPSRRCASRRSKLQKASLEA